MEEKIIIRGKPQGIKKVPLIVFIIGVVLFIITAVTGWSWDDIVPVMYAVSIGIIIGSLIMLYYVNSCEICVTDKRIYGKAAFGARVDIPIDSISAVGTISFWDGIVVSSSSGRIKFLYIDNADEIHATITKILIERQKKDTTITNITKENSAADELKKFKELLDCGVITQDEFNEKKKQLLK